MAARKKTGIVILNGHKTAFPFVDWKEVLRALSNDRERKAGDLEKPGRPYVPALEAYKAQGFTPDDFSHARAARVAMADALSLVEDAVDLGLRSSAGREAELQGLRDVRHRLEWELFP